MKFQKRGCLIRKMATRREMALMTLPEENYWHPPLKWYRGGSIGTVLNPIFKKCPVSEYWLETPHYQQRWDPMHGYPDDMPHPVVMFDHRWPWASIGELQVDQRLDQSRMTEEEIEKWDKYREEVQKKLEEKEKDYNTKYAKMVRKKIEFNIIKQEREDAIEAEGGAQ